MISSYRLLNNRWYPTSLNRLKVKYGCLIEIFKLRMMPISLGVAKILTFLIGTTDSRATWNIILNIFQWKVQLQVCLLLWGLLVCCISRGQGVPLWRLGVVQGPETLMHSLWRVKGLQTWETFLMRVLVCHRVGSCCRCCWWKDGSCSSLGLYLSSLTTSAVCFDTSCRTS